MPGGGIPLALFYILHIPLSRSGDFGKNTFDFTFFGLTTGVKSGSICYAEWAKPQRLFLFCKHLSVDDSWGIHAPRVILLYGSRGGIG